MGAVVSYDLEKARLKRGYRHADGKTDQERDCLRRSQASILAFEASRQADETASLLGAFNADPGRQAREFLAQTQAVACANTGWLVSMMAVAAAISSNVLQHTAYVLHRASVLSRGNNLGGTHVQNLARESEDVRR
jgi:hypothetical protein